MTEYSLRHLKYALAVAELGSMRSVARAFCVHESTVSRGVGAIERQLNIQIFHRDNTGVRLTADGLEWIRSVRNPYNSLEEALTCASRKNRENDKLRIGISTPFGREFLVRLFYRFEKAYPKIEVSIQDGSCRIQANAIRRRQLDAAFMCIGHNTRGVHAETIWQDGIAALLPADHPLAEKATLTWCDLVNERLLVPQGVDVLLLEATIMRHIAPSAQVPKIEKFCACQATVLLNVQIGKGFTIAGESFAKGVNLIGTVWRPIVGSGSLGHVQAIWLASNPKRTVLQLLGMARNVRVDEQSVSG